MEYTEREFYDLIEAVESEGGVHTPEMCVARRYTFTGKNGKPVTLPSCGNESLFEVPYLQESKGDTVTDGTVLVCAVDDDMGRWPRFGGDRFGR